MSIRICIADDHLLILSGIRQALQDAEDIEVVGVTHRGDEVMALVEDKLPDVALLEHHMPDMDGLSYLRLIKERHPQIKLVMLSASEDPVHIAEALNAGATAYIGKRINPRDLPSALRQIVEAVVYQTGPTVQGIAVPSVAVKADVPPCDLTERELTMLDAISRGLSTKAISRELWITEKTVKFHLTNIYRKLGVHNRASAVRFAFDHDLIRSPAQEPVLSATA